jgi:hypothetical protein
MPPTKKTCDKDGGGKTESLFLRLQRKIPWQKGMQACGSENLLNFKKLSNEKLYVYFMPKLKFDSHWLLKSKNFSAIFQNFCGIRPKNLLEKFNNKVN